MANRLTDLNVEFVSLVDRAAVRNAENPTEPQRFLVWKAERGDPTTDPTQGGSMTPEEAAALAKAEKDTTDAQAALAKSETEKAELTARVETLEKAAKPEPSTEEIDKADLPPAVVARLEKAETEAQELRKSAEEATSLAKAERDIRVTREFVAKAEKFTSLTVDPAVFGPVLKSASEKLTADESAELDRVLKAADEQLRQSGLLKEAGVSGDAKATGPEGELAQKAEELRKADPSLTDARARIKVMEGDKRLQQAYLDSHRQ
jgi:hypothetical protein